ncbi:DUF305 domain-containing protein [Nonomuraea lactucae]|uniref:DUF305 domain-containing protein n=1 Tax=Nonomuraea lactucae TaxID=2249762 RepID=UPI000DE369E3|nr:DUF305 domain-containing protein [Nonomuraea lactucae]
MRRVAAALCLLLVTALVTGLATACGSAKPAGGDPVNAQDVMFVQMMVQHHRQGIEIAKVGASSGRTPELKTLASAVAVTQQGEVEMMLRWLHAWGQPLTAPSGAHDHHGGMPETDRKQIAALRRAAAKKGSRAFEREWLNLLIAHQDDAVQMAGAEVSGGASPGAKKWAAQVQASRKAQIQQMLALLDALKS